MPKLINLRDVKPAAADFEPLPEGTYKVEITNAEIVKSQQTDDDMLKLELTLTASEDEYSGRKVWQYLTFGEKSLSITAQQVKSLMLAAGWDEDQLDELDIDEDWCQEMLGQEVYAVIGTRKGKGEYAGKIQNVIRAYAAELPETDE
jgi:hypothetical protein